MALEEALAECTKAVNGLAAIMAGKGAPAAVAEPGKRPPGRPRSISLDDVKAIAEKVRDEKGRPAAVALIKEHGADSLAELEKGKYAAFIAAAEVLLQDDGDGGGDEAAL